SLWASSCGRRPRRSSPSTGPATRRRSAGSSGSPGPNCVLTPGCTLRAACCATSGTGGGERSATVHLERLDAVRDGEHPGPALPRDGELLEGLVPSHLPP